MLTEKEKSGITQILKRLEPSDLHAIAATITKRTVVPESLLDAIDIIISQTSQAKELLHRKKIKRDVLMAYCISHKICVASNADKDTLVNLVAQHWGSPQTTECIEEEDFTETTSYSTERPEERDSVYLLAIQFANWFYTMLNQTPYGGSGGEVFGTHHFWPDARLNVTLVSAADPHNTQCTSIENNASEVVSTLINILKVPNILLNPNVPQGVTGRQDPHGLVVILVCGTVHQGSTLTGLFEQAFGLAKDPTAENRWKIKFTDLKMKETYGQHSNAVLPGPHPI